jgi:hypothetical protein
MSPSTDSIGSSFLGAERDLDGNEMSQLSSLAHRREPQVICLVEADLRANRPGRTLRWG